MKKCVARFSNFFRALQKSTLITFSFFYFLAEEGGAVVDALTVGRGK
jgi:hypothetical protein